MAVIYSPAVRSARLAVVRDAIDAGSGPGILELGNAGMALVLATLTCSKPCGTISGDTLTFAPIIQDSAADASGNAAVARFKDSDGNVIISGLTCGTSGTNIIMGSVSITVGQAVPMTSAAISHNTTGV
jgi:hypothetical protein